jgi:DNA-binding IclR family transcriptional regulator
MAQLPWSKVEERVGQYGLPALTESTVSSLDVFRRQLTDASRNCLATQDGELVEGQSCLAVGIRDSHRRVTAAVSICSTSERLHDSYDEFLLVLRRTARALADQGIPPAVPSARRRDAFGSVAVG